MPKIKAAKTKNTLATSKAEGRSSYRTSAIIKPPAKRFGAPSETLRLKVKKVASKPDSTVSRIILRLHKMYSKKGFLYDIYLLLIVYY